MKNTECSDLSEMERYEKEQDNTLEISAYNQSTICDEDSSAERSDISEYLYAVEDSKRRSFNLSECYNEEEPCVSITGCENVNNYDDPTERCTSTANGQNCTTNVGKPVENTNSGQELEESNLATTENKKLGNQGLENGNEENTTQENVNKNLKRKPLIPVSNSTNVSCNESASGRLPTNLENTNEKTLMAPVIITTALANINSPKRPTRGTFVPITNCGHAGEEQSNCLQTTNIKFKIGNNKKTPTTQEVDGFKVPSQPPARPENTPTVGQGLSVRRLEIINNKNLITDTRNAKTFSDVVKLPQNTVNKGPVKVPSIVLENANSKQEVATKKSKKRKRKKKCKLCKKTKKDSDKEGQSSSKPFVGMSHGLSLVVPPDSREITPKKRPLPDSFESRQNKRQKTGTDNEKQKKQKTQLNSQKQIPPQSKQKTVSSQPQTQQPKPQPSTSKKNGETPKEVHKFAICDKNQGFCLTEAQIKVLKAQLTRAIFEDDHGCPLPQFYSVKFGPGAIRFDCAKKENGKWLKKFAEKCSRMLPGLKLVVLEPNSCPKRPKILVRIQDRENTYITKVLKVIKRQNPGLNTNEWGVISHGTDGKCLTAVLSLDFNSFSVLQQKEFKLFFLFEPVEVTVVSYGLPPIDHASN